MCGRYVYPDDAAIERHFRLDDQSPHTLKRRFNTSPTSTVPMLMHRQDGKGMELQPARWGLVSQRWKQPKPPALTFNARSEEAASNPMWRHAYRNSRCPIPVVGWYEWQQVERVDSATGEILKVKQPHFIYRKDEPIFAFAGLVSRWTGSDGETTQSCAVFTKAAASSLTDVRERSGGARARAVLKQGQLRTEHVGFKVEKTHSPMQAIEDMLALYLARFRCRNPLRDQHERQTALFAIKLPNPSVQSAKTRLTHPPLPLAREPQPR